MTLTATDEIEQIEIAAHEIRNVLGAIKGCSAILKHELHKQPRLCHLADNILSSTDHLDDLLEKMLENDTFKPQPTDLVSFLLSLREQVRRHTLCHHQIEFIHDDPEVIASVDLGLLRPALMNLILNALQSMPDGGTLTITLNGRAIGVTDTGSGIHPADRERLFDLGFTTKPDGKGVGLLLVREAIKAHQGTIDIQSTVGAGTTVTLTL